MANMELENILRKDEGDPGIPVYDEQDRKNNLIPSTSSSMITDTIGKWVLKQRRRPSASVLKCGRGYNLEYIQNHVTFHTFSIDCRVWPGIRL